MKTNKDWLQEIINSHAGNREKTLAGNRQGKKILQSILLKIEQNKI